MRFNKMEGVLFRRLVYSLDGRACSACPLLLAGVHVSRDTQLIAFFGVRSLCAQREHVFVRIVL